jgi:hypothetical protein
MMHTFYTSPDGASDASLATRTVAKFDLLQLESMFTATHEEVLKDFQEQ